VSVEIRPAGVFMDVFRGKSLAYSMAWKLDNADLYRHVALERQSGILKRIRITPDDPDRFAGICQQLMAGTTNGTEIRT